MSLYYNTKVRQKIIDMGFHLVALFLRPTRSRSTSKNYAFFYFHAFFPRKETRFAATLSSLRIFPHIFSSSFPPLCPASHRSHCVFSLSDFCENMREIAAELFQRRKIFFSK